ncbi:type II secretion system secretin GspD [Candidatus Electronema sp. TJ]|uniref:type II secretion system secretin GspD n=1 Tax=Candidatus Electronema sp. TJ TaxID=3401573 RepID=UPI003AA89131
MRYFASFHRVAAAHLLTALFLLLCVAAPQGQAQEKEKKPPQNVQFNLPDFEITKFIQYISEVTGKNFIVDPAVRGKITIISPKQLSVEEAYRVFESVLEVHGFSTVPSGDVIKVVPAVQARSKSIPTLREGEQSQDDDKIVTRIIPLTHSNPEEMKRFITPLLSKTSVAIAHEQSGLLILTEALSNINRLLDIIKAVDVPSVGEELAIIPLKYASVDIVSKAIGPLFIQSAAPKGGRPTTIKIIPYERTNSLIVFAPKPQIERIQQLLAQLDSEVTREGGNIHVYYLQHANAEEMVKVLTNLPTGKQGADAAASRSSSMAKPKGTEEAARIDTVGGMAIPSAQLSSDIKISADPETNALIITASQEEYLVLQDVIKKLDIPRRMVYLEALIMEISVDKQFKIGPEWGGLGSIQDETGSLGAGFTSGSFGLINGISKGTAGMSSGATLGVLKKGVQIGGAYFPDLGAVVNAFQKDSDINIIATPQILTTDNKEASITVGENVPYITSKNSSSTGSTQDYTNYEYKDVGTTLKITPQINQANLLRLDIGVEVTRLKSEAGVATPTTYKRSATTTVVVHNQEIVVIGGMIGQDATSGDYKVPLLGDVPVLGWLFKTHENNKRRTNMFIFIAPRILDSSPELADLYYKKRDKMEEVKPGSGDVPEQLLKTGRDIEHAYALMDRGFAKLQEKERDEAKKYFQQALQNAPENPYALVNMGAIHVEEGDRDKAAEVYQQALNLAARREEDGKEADPMLLRTVRAALRRLELAEQDEKLRQDSEQEKKRKEAQEDEEKKVESPPASKAESKQQLKKKR